MFCVLLSNRCGPTAPASQILRKATTRFVESTDVVAWWLTYATERLQERLGCAYLAQPAATFLRGYSATQ